jgi:RNA polymerase sigma-70 factor (ECF subfamily)
MVIEQVTDAELVSRAAREDVDAFNALVRRWEKPLYNFALRLTGHREDALDLTQESFLKAYRQLRQLQSRDKFSHWLFKIALNLFYTSKRGSQESQTVSLEEEIGDGLHLGDVLPNKDMSHPDGFDRSILEQERARHVRRAISGLGADQRAAIILKIYHGMKFEEIAKIVGSPASTVKSRVYAAMETLQESLKEWIS